MIYITEQEKIVKHFFPVIYVGDHEIRFDHKDFNLTVKDGKINGIQKYKVTVSGSLEKILKSIGEEWNAKDIQFFENEFRRMRALYPMSYPISNCRR